MIVNINQQYKIKINKFNNKMIQIININNQYNGIQKFNQHIEIIIKLKI